MAQFDVDKAVFSLLAGEIPEVTEDTCFSYVNSFALNQFVDKRECINTLDLLEKLVGDRHQAKNYFNDLLKNGQIVVEGQLNGKFVQYHSMVDLNKKHIQAAIIDVTESRRAQEGFEYTAGALARASEVNDEDTGNHIMRINRYATQLAVLLSLDDQFVQNISILAQLHDVGKIYVDRSILRKPGKLTSAEMEEMRKHPIFGAKIIGDHPRLELARQIALSHHERWDGSGYPYGLSGEMIPLSARIVAVVDVFDALVSKRVYKEAYSYDQAYNIMLKGNDRLNPKKHFDPRILSLFTENFDKFLQIHQEFSLKKEVEKNERHL